MNLQLSAPFPYFGGKRNAAPIVWEALGDVGGYVEPFAGSAAVLLRRPTFTGRRVETLNDADGWLVNTWRAIQLDPDKVAEHADGPVTEIDYHARLAWLQARRTDDLVSWLEGDPESYDAKAAGWWLYVAACGIADPWGSGPWRVVDGRLVKTTGGGVNRELPHLGDAGQGVTKTKSEELAQYMRTLSTRLQQTRITAGSWQRVLKPSATRATATNSTVGIFLDPPYSTSGNLYASTNNDGDGHKTMSQEVREWCISEADPTHRVVLAGYDTEHDELLSHGWEKVAGKSGGGSGYNTSSTAGQRERLWLSPVCLTAQPAFDF